jgi:glycosyltransferase involved in cell wall biosynthesis
MRVLHLGAGNIYGGIERALVSYAAGRSTCSEMSPEFAICFPGRFESELKAEGVDVTILGAVRLSRRHSVSAARRRLFELLTNRRPDVVVTHGPWVHCVFGPVVRAAGIPLALFIHNPLGLHWLDLLARRTEPDLVIVNSRFTLHASRRWIGRIHSAICTYPFGEAKEFDRDRLRAALNIQPETVLILQASRLAPYKGHRLHLKALAEVARDSAWHALFVGSAQPAEERYARSLLTLRDTLGLAKRVEFLGHRSDVAELMTAADVFCHPNIGPEPFGMVFVEAMLAGLPVVATEMGGAKEILRDGGGLLVAPKPTPLARALRRLMMNRAEREEMGREGQRLAKHRYTMESATRALALALTQMTRRPLGQDTPEGDSAWV